MRATVPKRLQTNTGDQPRLGGATAKPAETATKQQPHKSPSVSRLRKVVSQVNIFPDFDVIRLKCTEFLCLVLVY